MKIVQISNPEGEYLGLYDITDMTCRIEDVDEIFRESFLRADTDEHLETTWNIRRVLAEEICIQI